MVERVSVQARSVLIWLRRPAGRFRRRRVLVGMPALALAITAVGATAAGPADPVATQRATLSPATVAGSGDLTNERVARPSRHLAARTPEPAPDFSAQQTTAATMTSGKAGFKAPRRAAIRGDRYLTANLNIRTGPSLTARVVAVLPRGSKVQVTKATQGQFTQIIFRDQTRYAATRYLSGKKPQQAKARPKKPSPSRPGSLPAR